MDLQKRPSWSSQIGLVMAAAGSAIGLGNIWKFPYLAGDNGGGFFVLIYLLCVLLVGIPVFISELFIGASSKKNAIKAFEVLDKPKSKWQIAGIFGVGAAAIILSYYSVIGGWVLDYEFKSIFNFFSTKTDKEVTEALDNLLATPWLVIFWHFAFMAMTIGIVIGGIEKGIEKWNKRLMPLLFIVLLVLIFRVMFEPGFLKGLAFLLVPNMSRVTPNCVLVACGQAFFSLSLGLGVLITYGSYMKDSSKIIRTSFEVAILDTIVALMAAVIIFAIVFSFGMNPDKGPGLVFVTLPILFNKMFGSYFISNLFFLLLIFAAITSSISLLEVVVTFLTEYFNWERKKLTIIGGTLIALFGVPSALSFNLWNKVTLFGMGIFDILDFISSSIFLPVGGVVISVFYGWKLGKKAVEATTGKPIAHFFSITLLWLTRIVAPLAILIMLIHNFIK